MMTRALIMACIAAVAAGGTVLAGEEGKRPMPGPEHKKLDYFTGDWTAEGDVKESPFGPGGKFTSKDSCKWFEGGFAIICHSTGKGPMGPMKGLGILGYNAEGKFYTYYGVDNSGMVMASVPRGTVDGDTWTYTSEDQMGGQTISSRYVLKIESPNAYTFKWEIEGEGGEWTQIMSGTVTRTKAAKGK